MFYTQNQIPFVMGITGGDRNKLEQAVKNSSTPAVIAPNMANQRGNTRKDNTKKSQTIPKTPHEILGVRSDASKKEIQAAYKEAIKKYHPDKVSHLGDEFATLANEKFVEIQNAYDTLMKT